VFASCHSCLQARNTTSLVCLTCCQCLKLCDFTTCYSMDRAWFKRLKLKHHNLVSKFAFNFNLRRYSKVDAPPGFAPFYGNFDENSFKGLDPINPGGPLDFYNLAATPEDLAVLKAWPPSATTPLFAST